MLSIITPTIGRPTLKRLVASVDTTWLDADEWLIVGDTRHGVEPWVKPYVEELGHPFRYLEYGKEESCYGHPQRNYAMTQAREGNYLVFNDDTDEFALGAIDMVREEIGRRDVGPMLFSFEIDGGTWSARNNIFPGLVGGHQIVTPNIPGKLGRWEQRYEGDFDFIEQTVALWDGIARVDRLLALAWQQRA